jgi:hypothetical protein
LAKLYQSKPISTLSHYLLGEVSMYQSSEIAVHLRQFLAKHRDQETGPRRQYTRPRSRMSPPSTNFKRASVDRGTCAFAMLHLPIPPTFTRRNACARARRVIPCVPETFRALCFVHLFSSALGRAGGRLGRGARVHWLEGASRQPAPDFQATKRQGGRAPIDSVWARRLVCVSPVPLCTPAPHRLAPPRRDAHPHAEPADEDRQPRAQVQRPRARQLTV